jgi:hypothetical protein
LCICDAQTFTLNDEQDYAICEIWLKAFLDIKNFAILTFVSVARGRV